jgi:hypothetical protein
MMARVGCLAQRGGSVKLNTYVEHLDKHAVTLRLGQRVERGV